MAAELQETSAKRELCSQYKTKLDVVGLGTGPLHTLFTYYSLFVTILLLCTVHCNASNNSKGLTALELLCSSALASRESWGRLERLQRKLQALSGRSRERELRSEPRPGQGLARLLGAAAGDLGEAFWRSAVCGRSSLRSSLRCAPRGTAKTSRDGTP